jgi:two-component system, response regulator
MLEKTPEVLLVEDNVDDAAITIQSLKKACPGLRIELVRDGAAALDFMFSAGAYARRPFGLAPDLIILDMRLPKASGLDVLRVLKFYVHTRNVPVIVFTATTDEQVILESQRLGVSDYIIKPTDFDQYRKVIRRVAARWLETFTSQGFPSDAATQSPTVGAGS